jgi:hypothetical protein
MASGRCALIAHNVSSIDASSVYTNSMLASLNARKALRRMQAAPHSEPLVFLRSLASDSARERPLFPRRYH